MIVPIYFEYFVQESFWVETGTESTQRVTYGEVGGAVRRETTVHRSE